MLFNRPVQTVFIDTHTPPVESDATMDVILSPAYYWVKRQKLPVRYLREARKLLPSIFEDMLPEGSFSYEVYKQDDHFMLFAYSDKTILDLLHDKGVKPSQIRNIYLAQSEFDALETPLRIDGQTILAVRDGIVVKLPAAFSPESVPMDLSGHKGSPHAVTVTRYAHITGQGNMLRFGSLLGVLTLLLAVQWWIVADKTRMLEAKQAEVFARYDLKSTQMQNEAILESLESRYKSQEALRRAVQAVLGLRLAKDEHLSTFTVQGGLVKASWSIPGKERADAIAAELKKSGLNLTHRFREQTLEMEASL